MAGSHVAKRCQPSRAASTASTAIQRPKQQPPPSFAITFACALTHTASVSISISIPLTVTLTF